MADTTISGLATAATALAPADLMEIEQGAASKKSTAGLIRNMVMSMGTPVAAAATTTLGDGMIFHITGSTGITDIDFTDSWNGRTACLIFDAAPLITHNATTLMLPGGADLRMAAGDRMWFTVDSGDNVIVIDHISAMSLTEEFWIRQAAARTLANVGTAQKVFDAVTNGSLTLPIGVYFFEWSVYLTGMSATTGNAGFDLKGAGTATFVDVLYWAHANEAVAAGTIGTSAYSTMIQAATPALVAPTAITTTLSFHAHGSFEISVAGTIIPSLTLTTATAACSVAAGTYFSCRKVGPTNGVSGGPWT